MGTIITTHIPMNMAKAPGQDCPGIRIHAIDIVQPPTMGMPPDMEPHQTIVPHAPATKRSAQAERNARSPVKSA